MAERPLILTDSDKSVLESISASLEKDYKEFYKSIDGIVMDTERKGQYLEHIKAIENAIQRLDVIIEDIYQVTNPLGKVPTESFRTKMSKSFKEAVDQLKSFEELCKATVVNAILKKKSIRIQELLTKLTLFKSRIENIGTIQGRIARFKEAHPTIASLAEMTASGSKTFGKDILRSLPLGGIALGILGDLNARKSTLRETVQKKAAEKLGFSSSRSKGKSSIPSGGSQEESVEGAFSDLTGSMGEEAGDGEGGGGGSSFGTLFEFFDSDSGALKAKWTASLLEAVGGGGISTRGKGKDPGSFDLMKVITSIGPFLAGLIGPIISGIGTLIGPLLGGISAFLGPVIAGIGPMVMAALPIALPALAAVVGGFLISKIKIGDKNIGEHVTGFFGNLFGKKDSKSGGTPEDAQMEFMAELVQGGMPPDQAFKLAEARRAGIGEGRPTTSIGGIADSGSLVSPATLQAGESRARKDIAENIYKANNIPVDDKGIPILDDLTDEQSLLVRRTQDRYNQEAMLRENVLTAAREKKTAGVPMDIVQAELQKEYLEGLKEIQRTFQELGDKVAVGGGGSTMIKKQSGYDAWNIRDPLVSSLSQGTLDTM